MLPITINVNEQSYSIEVTPDTPLLWVLRDHLGLTGTKFSCGIGLCGACTVHLDGEAFRSCSVPVSEAVGREITTIEGLSKKGDHEIQLAWMEEEVPQCGYCQPGQIMSATALLASNPKPSDEEINTALANVLCRCGTYQRIRRAIHRVSAEGGVS
jgi:isoquinoline 1-oxidoreductase alpha subunit